MRRFKIFLSVSLLTMTAGVAACDDGDDGTATDEAAETADTADTADTATTDTADTTTADTADTTGCPYEQPAECAQLIECLDVILPGTDLSKYQADGDCWCGTEDEALGCYNVCKDQLAMAVSQNPTVGECSGRYCPLEELDPAQPYGPPPCTAPAEELSLPIPGSYCAPPCGGVAQYCQGHTQTIADGVCYWGGGDNGFCALWCYVDPFVFPSGTQCQCGATCQPYGGADGDGNQRGVCSFE